MRDGQVFDDVVEECLQRIEHGESVDACLRAFPEHAADLAPILAVAAELRALPVPPLTSAARNAARARAQAAYARRFVGRAAGGWWMWRPVLGFALGLVLVLTICGAGVASAQ